MKSLMLSAQQKGIDLLTGEFLNCLTLDYVRSKLYNDLCFGVEWRAPVKKNDNDFLEFALLSPTVSLSHLVNLV